MTWHYQIRKQEDKGYVWYDIVECYENPRGWTKHSMAPSGVSPEGVIECLEMMLADAKKYPVLEDVQT
jgi:hypothetical protein